MTLIVECPAFASYRSIPPIYTEDGSDLSPELQWGRPPEHTKEWVLIVDAAGVSPNEPWVHWLLYNLPAKRSVLPGALPAVHELAEPAGARQGINSWGTVGYRGPAPPHGHGPHRYHFRVAAIDKRLNLPPGITREELQNAMEGHIVDQGELVGTYERQALGVGNGNGRGL